MAEPQNPAHVAIITDGNGRWARARGLPVGAGHRAGADNVRARLRDAVELGIRELSVYAFSTENWTRSEQEVRDLIELLIEYIDGVTPELHAQNVRLRFLGDRGEPVPRRLVERMEWAEQLTEANGLITLYVPFNYGGRAEIVRAARRYSGGDETGFREGFYAPEMHDPELLIRTGGDQRLSNYLLWQLADAELVFCDELWPDFTRDQFELAIDLYRKRCRGSSTDGAGAQARAR